MAYKYQPRPIRVVEAGPAINTTPLIDLMLVLIVMLIVSIPIASHEMPLELPRPDVGPAAPAPVHRLDIDAAGRLAWDGRPIADAELAQRLAAMNSDPALPVLHLAADAETRYQRVDETLAVVLRAGITRLGFVGNERYLAMLD